MPIHRSARALLTEVEGATLVEYAIMVAAIAAVSIAVVGSIGGRVLAMFTSASLW